jgi:two-component system, NtrC family, response regulator AtoC
MGATLDGEATHIRAAASLVVVMEDGCISRYGLPVSGAVKIGRGGACDIMLHDPSASRLHAVLHVGERVELEDAGSHNGTLVRGARIAKASRVGVAPGDSIQIGNAVLMLQASAGSGASRYALGPSRRDLKLDLVLRDPAMHEVYDLASRVAASNISVLILGETGVGKELVAETVHRLAGARAREPFVPINCAALSESLLESELFGHERGSFTGALQSKPGLLESAGGGTVFLDEVGELPLAMQPKLLRVIESRQVTRVGGLKSHPLGVRFIAATNRDLRAEIRLGRFRQDLFFRLSGITISVPPLRERPADIEPLARTFAVAIASELSARAGTFAPAALELLQGYEWPGNVRELRNVVESAFVLAGGHVIEAHHLPEELRAPPPEHASGDRYRVATTLGPLSDARSAERSRILEALAACNGNQTRAAEYLRMPRRTLVAKLAAYAIPRPRKPSLSGS